MAPLLPDTLPFPAAIEPSEPIESQDGSLPPPFPLPGVPRFPLLRSVKPGCWLLSYRLANSSLVAYDGTLRVEHIDGGRRASGDLYQRRTIRIPAPVRGTQLPTGRLITILLPPPNPADGIPILPIDRYSYFLRVTKILESVTFGQSFELGLEMNTFSHTDWSTSSPGLGQWVGITKCSAIMKWVPDSAPAGFTLKNHYLEGDLKTEAGVVMGQLTMGWVSDLFRKITIEIDTVAGSERPLDSGSGQDWSTVGAGMGYDLKLVLSEQNVPDASSDSWANLELHSAMEAHREAVDLNLEWRYHILAVKNLDETPRGIMYDDKASDSNRVPREGLGISTHWIIPSGWGSSSGVRFGLAKAAHFRTAVHELGHALGLVHNTVDLGFMNTSDVIADAGNTRAPPFPDNVKWAFADDDLERLRHRPDLYVRPGGVVMDEINDFNPLEAPNDQALALEVPELKLTLTPLLAELPLGAPVRVELKLTNKGDTSIAIPARIDLKSSRIRGAVSGPSGKARTFTSLFGCLDEEGMVDLAPQASVAKSITLLRGGEGTLFPTSGVSTIMVQFRWPVSPSHDSGTAVEAVVSASTTVFIMAPRTDSHAKTAHKILTTPDAHLVLALGCTSLKDGVEAVDAASACGTLGPHWKVVRAKALARSGRTAYGKEVLGKRDDCVMSPHEEEKLTRLLK